MEQFRAILNIVIDDGCDLNRILPIVDNFVPLDEKRHDRNIRNPRNKNFFEKTIPLYNEDLFKEHFRMKRSTYQELLTIVGNRIGNNQVPSVNISKQLLFTIWLLAKPESFLAAGDRFDLAKSTSHNIFKQMIETLSNLLKDYVRWPDRDAYQRSANVFNVRSRGFPGVIGAIDGCHIPCKQPPGNANDYYNRKGFHSIILQGVCNEEGQFIDCYIGMPGRMHDANFHIIGDSAYPLGTHLMTPFRDNGHLSRRQIHYNTKLSSIKSIIERAFGHLKGRFRRLKYLDVGDINLGIKIVAAACVLHNFIISSEKDFNPDEVLHQEEINLMDGIEEELVNNAGTLKRLSIVELMYQ